MTTDYVIIHSEARTARILQDDKEAKEEGIDFRYLANPKVFNGDKDGKLVSTTVDTMELGAEDKTGRRTPEPVPEQEFEMKSSAVLLAIGRGPNSFLQNEEGLKIGKKDSIQVDDHFRTFMAGVFAAGDVTTGESLVVRAMGSGREAAQRVHEYLMDLKDDVHVSLYERYFVQRSFEVSSRGDVIGPPPP